MAPEPQINSNWLLPVAAKKISWGVGKLIAAKLSAPAVATGIASASSTLQPYGITIQIDPVLLSNSLPVLLFGGLVAAHDYLKLKKPWTWL